MSAFYSLIWESVLLRAVNNDTLMQIWVIIRPFISMKFESFSEHDRSDETSTCCQSSAVAGWRTCLSKNPVQCLYHFTLRWVKFRWAVFESLPPLV